MTGGRLGARDGDGDCDGDRDVAVRVDGDAGLDEPRDVVGVTVVLGHDSGLGSSPE